MKLPSRTKKRKLVMARKNLRSVEAFTVIECLFALFIVGIILHSTTTVIQQSQTVKAHVRARHTQEWHVALIQLEAKIAMYDLLEVTTHEMKFREKGGNKILFVHYLARNHEIKLQENGGYQPILTEVSAAHFSFDDRTRQLSMEVRFKDGRTKTACLIHTK